jgi:hypothetical protein
MGGVIFGLGEVVVPGSAGILQSDADPIVDSRLEILDLVMGNPARIRTIDRLPIDTALQPQTLSPQWNPFSATGIPVSEIDNYVLREFRRPLSRNAFGRRQRLNLSLFARYLFR